MIKKSYIDDLGLTADSMQELKGRTLEADTILKHANMKVKHWMYSGKYGNSSKEVSTVEVVSHDGAEGERMLGVYWKSGKDIFKFSMKVNLSPLKNKERSNPDLSKEDLMSNPIRKISKRQFYSQI